MSAPTGLLSLGLTLRPEHSPERQQHVAHLAARLGYTSVWLPLPPDGPWPSGQALSRLRAGPAAVGVVVPGSATSLLSRLPSLPSDVLVELEVPAGLRAAVVAALGGEVAWRARCHARTAYAGDATALAGGTAPQVEGAGLVVVAETRPALLTAVATAASVRAAAGRTPASLPVTAALTVSIGRTVAEADARARRDPALAGPNHPALAGLFGTLEHAQSQALELRRAGADAIRATLADDWDVADLLAQLRAVVVGPTAVLHAREASTTGPDAAVSAVIGP